MPRRTQNPEVREKILTTAIEVFVEKGYHATTTLEISQRAKLSSSHMYIYYKDKEDLLVAAILRMKDEHTAMSAELASKSAGLDDGQFIELFYETQAQIRHRVRFIMVCILTPGLAALFAGIDFDFSGVFMPYLNGWQEDLAADTALALASIAAGYFFTGNADGAKASSLSILKNARLALGNPQ
jgi:AcrR family transcriptional regulator